MNPRASLFIGVVLLALALAPLALAQDDGSVFLCINARATLVNPGSQFAIIGQPFNLTINATDINNDTLLFTDNTSLFTINSSTGNIFFTPLLADNGTHSIHINVTEFSSCQTITQTITFDLSINASFSASGWDLLVRPQGIYEPLCCGTSGNPTNKTGFSCLEDGTYSPVSLTGDVFCEGSAAGQNDPLDNQHVLYVTFHNLTISPSEILTCTFDMSDGTLFTINTTGVGANSTTYTLNRSISFNDTITRDTGAASIHDVPWYIYNCSITATNGTTVFNESINRRLFVHSNLLWTAFDYQKALFCESVPFKFFNNTAICDLSSIDGSLKSYERNLALKKVAGTPVELHCQDGIDNDNDGTTDSADIDCLTFTNDDNVTFYNNFTLETGSVDFSAQTSTPDADNIRSDTVGSTTYQFTVNTRATGALEVRIQESTPGTNGYGFTLMDVPNVDGMSVIGDAPGLASAILSKSCSGGLCNVNYDCSGSPCQNNTAVDIVLAMNFTNTTQEGLFNITIQAVYGLQVSEDSFLTYFDNTDGLENNNESDTSATTAANLCSDGVNNDLDISTDYTYINALAPFNRISYSRDCADIDCNAITGPTYAAEQDITFTLGACEYRTELSCADGYDNDFNDNFTTDAFGIQGFPYTDCHDTDCFQNGIECPAVESICNDGINNDWDYVGAVAAIGAVTLTPPERRRS